MKMHIQPHRGNIKRKGEPSLQRRLRIEIQDQAEVGGNWTFVFKEKAAEFFVKPGFYAAVIVRITDEEGMTGLSSLEEHSVSLTMSQAESVMAGLQKALDELATGMKRIVPTPGPVAVQGNQQSTSPASA